MNIIVVGLHKMKCETLIRKRYPKLHLVRQHPDIVVSFGGDGTLLFSERHYPGIPKAMIRISQICPRCAREGQRAVLRALQYGTFEIQEHMKLEATFGKKKLIGMNDIVIGHPRVNGTLRAQLLTNGKHLKREFIADGVVFSTPLGSTGYYQSITHSNFINGIGLAFNNAVRLVNHLVMGDDAVIDVKITRGPGVFAADNDEREIHLATGDVVRVQRSTASARIVLLSGKDQRFNLTASKIRMPLGFCQICQQQYVR